MGGPCSVRSAGEQDDARHAPARQHQGLRVSAGHHLPALRRQVRKHHGKRRHVPVLLQVVFKLDPNFYRGLLSTTKNC